MALRAQILSWLLGVFANHRRAGRAIADFIQERLQSQQ